MLSVKENKGRKKSSESNKKLITKAQESKLLVPQKSKKISADMTILEVISKHPKTIKTFLSHGMTCMGCPFAMSETVEQAAQAHGISIGELMNELNESSAEKKKLKK